ncbi:MAG: sugar ABC transporter permease YjfF [Opitutaceae bacterium]|nr:sugar ABC transporter permease YjfF [Opitutaceae bacterium]
MKAQARRLQRHLPLLVTAGIFVLLFGAASVAYEGFLSLRTLTSLLTDNAFLGIAAVGMTLVIFSGGIDLSVGAVIGFTSIFTATLIERTQVPPGVAWVLALAAGTAMGGGMGALIHFYRLPPFLITLAGLFLARGAAFWINTESVGIGHAVYNRLSAFEVPVGPASLTAGAVVLLAVLVLGYGLAHHTRLGRTLLAMGGSEQSALLMGLPIGAAKVGVYALNGFCGALAGIVATLYTGSGNPSMGVGLELDAIAIVVIGGTLLTGGRGHLVGTILGILIFGTIQAAILFDGRLSSWWMRIVVGGLLLAFVLLQRLLLGRRRT